MPVLPVCLLDPVWQQFSALLPAHPVVAALHPLRCHRPRVPDRVVFDHVIAALVHGSGYERIATVGCSDRTIRRRVHAWAKAGLGTTLHRLALEQYDHLIGIEFGDLVVDGCITKAPNGGEKAGRSPVDRGNTQRVPGLKRSTVTDARGLPLALVSAGANRHDSPLLESTLVGLAMIGPLPAGITVHLDRGYDSEATRTVIGRMGITGVIAHKGIPPSRQVGKRWVVERTQSWMNGFGKLRRCTERSGTIVDFYLAVAAAFVVVRRIIEEARPTFRWLTRPTTRRLT